MSPEISIIILTGLCVALIIFALTQNGKIKQLEGQLHSRIREATDPLNEKITNLKANIESLQSTAKTKDQEIKRQEEIIDGAKLFIHNFAMCSECQKKIYNHPLVPTLKRLGLDKKG